MELLFFYKKIIFLQLLPNWIVLPNIEQKRRLF